MFIRDFIKNADRLKIDLNNLNYVILSHGHYDHSGGFRKNEMSKKYSKDKVAILMINLTDGQRETMSTAKQFIEDNNYNMKVLFDNKMNAANSYNISAIPRTIFIDKDGYIVQDNPAGVITKEELESQIKLLLK